MYRTTIVLLILWCTFSYQPSYSQTIVTCEITGLQDKDVNTLYLFSVSKQKNIDTVSNIKGNTFSFTIKQSTPDIYMIACDEKKLGFSCWVENTDSIKIFGNVEELIPPGRISDLRIKRVHNHLQKSGSIEQAISDSFFHDVEDSLREHFFMNYDSGKNGFIGEDATKLISLNTTIFNKLVSLIERHPNSAATQFIIWYLQEEGVFTNEQTEMLKVVISRNVDINTPLFDPRSPVLNP
jgi:hypothetical protein